MSNGSAKPQSNFSKKSFHFVAGLSSGLFSAVLLQPADLLKTRVQQSSSALNPHPLLNTLRDIFSSPQPVRQLWRGTLPSALRTGCGSALYFGGLNALRAKLAESGVGIAPNSSASSNTSSSSSALPKLSNSANLLTGAVARAAAGFAMMPITVIKVRYESSLYSYGSLAGATSAIWSKEGFRGFFAGFGATAVRDAPYAGLYVLFYEAGKRQLGGAWARLGTTTTADGDGGSSSSDGSGTQKKNTRSIGSSAGAGINFASGVVAAGFATAITNPFDAIKTRLQLLPQRYGNMVRAARMMLRDEGVRCLFDGLALRMARKAMSSALAWTVYEELIRRAETRWVEGEKKML